MQITRARPYARGVDQLMYVGDDGTAAAPPTAMLGLTTMQLVAVAAIALTAPKGGRLERGGWSAAAMMLWNLLKK